MLKFGLILAAAMAVSSSAMADGSWSAKLMAPATVTEVAAVGVVWTCKADVCTTASDLTDVDPQDACVGLTREVGPVASFGALPADKLAKCNRYARHA
jgi:hypothetical protein